MLSLENIPQPLNPQNQKAKSPNCVKFISLGKVSKFLWFNSNIDNIVPKIILRYYMKYLSTSPPTSEISYNLVSKNLPIMSSL